MEFLKELNVNFNTTDTEKNVNHGDISGVVSPKKMLELLKIKLDFTLKADVKYLANACKFLTSSWDSINTIVFADDNEDVINDAIEIIDSRDNIEYHYAGDIKDEFDVKKLTSLLVDSETYETQYCFGIGPHLPYYDEDVILDTARERRITHKDFSEITLRLRAHLLANAFLKKMKVQNFRPIRNLFPPGLFEILSRRYSKDESRTKYNDLFRVFYAVIKDGDYDPVPWFESILNTFLSTNRRTHQDIFNRCRKFFRGLSLVPNDVSIKQVIFKLYNAWDKPVTNLLISDTFSDTDYDYNYINLKKLKTSRSIAELIIKSVRDSEKDFFLFDIRKLSSTFLDGKKKEDTIGDILITLLKNGITPIVYTSGVSCPNIILNGIHYGKLLVLDHADMKGFFFVTLPGVNTKQFFGSEFLSEIYGNMFGYQQKVLRFLFSSTQHLSPKFAEFFASKGDDDFITVKVVDQKDTRVITEKKYVPEIISYGSAYSQDISESDDLPADRIKGYEDLVSLSDLELSFTSIHNITDLDSLKNFANIGDFINLELVGKFAKEHGLLTTIDDVFVDSVVMFVDNCQSITDDDFFSLPLYGLIESGNISKASITMIEDFIAKTTDEVAKTILVSNLPRDEDIGSDWI